MFRRLAACMVIVAAVTWTFSPVREFAFLNWDDDAVIVNNAALDDPGALRWAFTTTYMEHYQPLSWLAWVGIKRTTGATASAFHTANLAVHVVCAALVFMVALAVLRRAQPVMPAGVHEALASAAALFYAVHPLRVEVVAWSSALPYALALALALLSALAWLQTRPTPAASWWMGSFALYVLSLVARPIALGLPLVFLVIDYRLLDRSLRATLRRIAPFAAVAIIAAIVEGVARAPGANDTSWLFRLQSVTTAPFVYLWHTVAPLRLTPLDVLPANPVANPALMMVSLLTLMVLAIATWTMRARQPWLWATLVAYLALLAPAAGLMPSGQQATADRYSYLPGVVVAIAMAAAVAVWSRDRPSRRWIAGVATVLVIGVSIAASRQALPPWRDSMALWSRVVELDPANDVGLYNLGTALEAAGQRDQAAGRYRQALAIEPQHAAARANLDRLEAARFEQDGNSAAAGGDLAAAADSYRRAVALDPRRTHSQAGLGMALAGLGRAAEAIPSLRTAIAQGNNDAEIANTLAGLLAASGRAREAREVLETALATHQTDINLGHNLARLLVTDPQFAASDAPLALRLASAIASATGERDPRALDTLAAALAMNGRRAEAAETADRAARLAAARGDRELAVQITARSRAYRNPGR